MNFQEQEIWKPVKGYEGCYSISTLGNIKREKAVRGAIVGKELKPYKSKRGYLTVGLCENNKLKTLDMHRLVAITFLGKPLKGLGVNHIDGVKTNNHVSNLEYVTQSENMRHAVKLGLHKPKMGDKHYTTKLKEKDVLKIRYFSSNNIYTQNELSKIYKITRKTIRRIINRTIWKNI